MAKPLRWLRGATLVIASTTVISSGLSAARTCGYLPLAGPAPLRFQPAPAPHPELALPPLTPAAEPATAVSTNSAPAAPTEIPSVLSTNQVPWPGPSETEQSLPANELWPDVSQPPTQTDPPPINSKSVLQYLLPMPPVPDGAKPGIPAFVPPTPAPANHTSSATYEVQ